MLLSVTKGCWVVSPAPFVFLNLVFFLLFNSTVIAQTLQRLSLEDLAKEADVIVMGRVQKTSSQQTAKGFNMTTQVEVNVIEQWKGPKNSSVIVSQPGGSAGAITQAVPGLPQFTVGQEVILFLKQLENGYFQTVGGNQGKILVKTDPKTRTEFTQDLTGKSQSLEDFLKNLKAALK